LIRFLNILLLWRSFKICTCDWIWKRGTIT